MRGKKKMRSKEVSKVFLYNLCYLMEVCINSVVHLRFLPYLHLLLFSALFSTLWCAEFGQWRNSLHSSQSNNIP